MPYVPSVKALMLLKSIGRNRLRNVAMVALVSAHCVSGCSSGGARASYFALQPFGEIDEKLLTHMCRFVEAAYATSCKVLKPLDLPSGAFDRARRQYRASELLSFLKGRFPREALKVVAVTGKDIYTRQTNFVFGLADLSGKVCVLSTCRLRQSFWGKPQDDSLLYARTLKVLYHELAHTFGMRHCDKIQCAMCYHNSLPELDASFVRFCPTCARELERRAGPFPPDRDAKIAKLLAEIGLPKDAKLYSQGKEAER